MEPPFDGRLSGEDEIPLLADWVSSPMAASEQSSSQNLVLTDRPLSGIPYGRFGSVAALQRVTKRHQAVTGQQRPVSIRQ